MAFDYKKEYKQFYAPAKIPTIIEIPKMQFLAVRGKGNPNEEGGEYQQAINQLFSIAYTLKMSYKSEYKIEGFFEYVVPPLEGFWWQEKLDGVDYSHKEQFSWISIMRVPDFVQEKDFLWAKEITTKKKKINLENVELLEYREGLCVQCMHIGSFDDEPETIAQMECYARNNGYKIDINEHRYHHEIYLSDFRKSDPLKMKTVIRHPVIRVGLN